MIKEIVERKKKKMLSVGFYHGSFKKNTPKMNILWLTSIQLQTTITYLLYFVDTISNTTAYQEMSSPI